VRDLLHSLSQEVHEVKQSIEGLKTRAPTWSNTFGTPGDGTYWDDWDDWHAWYSLGMESGVSWDLGQPTEHLLPEISENSETVLTKEMLLAYKSCKDSGDCNLSQERDRSTLHSQNRTVSQAPELQGVWEPIDPWVFLDMKELANISQTCRKSFDLVSANTPFFDVSAEMGSNESVVLTACGEPQEDCGDSESFGTCAEFESFVDNAIACFANELQQSMRTGCVDMIKDAFGQGFSAEAISNQFMDICRTKVSEEAAQVTSKVQQHWPQLADSIDLEARLTSCLQTSIFDWMSEALISNRD